MLTTALALLLFSPPTSSPVGSPVGAPAPGQDAPTAAVPATAPAPAADYSAEQAKADVEVVLVDRGKAYLEARARLEDHPKLAAEAVIARLEGVPAPGPEKRDRLLNVLAALGQPEHVELFAEQLRVAIAQDRPVELWMQLLRRQGPAATKVLIELIGDRELSNEQRGLLLDALVELSSRETLADLLVMVGRGATELQHGLRRALIRRSRSSADDSSAIAAGIDANLDTDLDANPGEHGRVAQLLILRAACCGVDPGFEARLEALASDPAAAFPVRVAAIDGLRRLGLGESVLTTLVREQASAALAGTQASEVLMTLALEALPAAAGSGLADELGLLSAAAPRLAELGYRLAALAPDHAWLAPSQTHAWPEVRRAALARVGETGPCEKPTVRELAKIAGPISAGGDKDARVGRAAVGALGRCGDPLAFKTLRELLEDTGVDVSQRAEAARQLAEHDPNGAEHVAELLLDGRYPDLARELAFALGHAAAPSETVRDALCRVGRANPMVASTAYESLNKLFPGQGCEADSD
jgi:hypothetical protein